MKVGYVSDGTVAIPHRIRILRKRLGIQRIVDGWAYYNVHGEKSEEYIDWIKVPTVYGSSSTNYTLILLAPRSRQVTVTAAQRAISLQYWYRCGGWRGCYSVWQWYVLCPSSLLTIVCEIIHILRRHYFLVWLCFCEVRPLRVSVSKPQVKVIYIGLYLIFFLQVHTAIVSTCG